MGQEIESSRFRKRDFEAFGARLAEETALLREWFAAGRFSDVEGIGGFELEAWLVGADRRPAPINERFLELLASPLATPELARFNVEVNGTPRALTGDALAALHAELDDTWRDCTATARALGADIAMVGILPTVRDEDLCLANMSSMTRYRALNEQVLRLRQGRPLELDITGREHLQLAHHDVMLESAATSFQIHLQVHPQSAVRYYNAAVVLAAPMVAVSANSPFLFGRDLWDETRIPLFEQAVAVGGYQGAAFGPIRRVSFGSGYMRDSLFECFQENAEHYPPLLPVELEGAPEMLPHLRLHNGTIWRWNRPLIGFDDARPHLRIEHRVVPAGPTVVDTIANAAFFYGAVSALATAETPPESGLDFVHARDNFYAAARTGLRATLLWSGERRVGLQRLLLEELLPLAEAGLRRRGIAEADVRRYLGIVRARVESGRNGAQWQRDFVAAHGADPATLVAGYLERQNGGAPVHGWTL